MGKSVAAVVAGFVAWSVLHLVNMYVIRTTWPDAIGEDGSVTEILPLALMLFITFDQSFVAGVVCRLVAKTGKAPLALAVLLTTVGLVVQGMGWDLMPEWYHISFLVMLMPMTLLGAKVVTLKRKPS